MAVLHTGLYGWSDLGARSHGWKGNDRNTNLQKKTKKKTENLRYLCAPVWHIWVRSASPLPVCVHMCMSERACVCVSWMQKYSVHHLFFETVTHHGPIVPALPTNHMSGLLMLVPSHINQIGLKMILCVQNHKERTTESK